MKSRSTMALVGLLIATFLATGGTPVRASNPVTVNITILRIVEIDCDDNDVADVDDSCGNDYYVKAFIDGQERVSPRAPDNATTVEPYWQLRAPVEVERGTIGVRLQLMDHDSTSGDDQIDIKTPGDSDLDFTVNLADGTFQVPDQGPNVGYGAGTGEDSAKILFTVSLGDNGDIDGDGIPNGVELYGVIDDNGSRVLDLRAKGANPCRKDVAVEVDYMNGPDLDGTPGPDYTHRPQPATQAEVIAAFNAAPIPAPVGCTIPGFGAAGGINFIWLIDQNMPFQDKVDWKNGGDAIRNANFNAALVPYVAYSLWNHDQPDVADGPDPGSDPDINSSSGLCCGSNGKSVLVSLGEWTNGTGTAREQSGTLMHELGHALGLEHGGNDKINCKPNYLSVESYVFQGTGVPDTSLPAPVNDLNKDGKVDNRDRFRLDYSRSTLPQLNENSLIEGNGIGDGTDQTFWGTSGTGNVRTWNVGNGNTWIDWNGNKVQDTGAVGPIDINNMGVAGSQGCPNPSPGQLLNGFDDWQNLRYLAGRPGSAGSGQDDHDRLTYETFQTILSQIRAAQSTSDISVSMGDSPDPVAAGTNLTYSIVVRANGPVPSYDIELKDTLPSDVTFVSASAGCAHVSGTVTCTRGELTVGSEWTATITVGIPADLVYRKGGPTTLSNQATVRHDGTDPVMGNNGATGTTQVVAVADVKIDSLTTTSPLELIIGQPGSATIDIAVDNGGPSSPIDAVLTGSATADPGAAVTPAATTADLTALAAGTPRTVSQTFDLSCGGPGLKTISFSYGVALANAADTDPDLTNNLRSASFQVDCVVPVAINIRPGGYPNSINLNTDATLAVLTTRAGEYGLPLAFDARTIDAVTVRFGLKSNLFNVGSASGAAEMHIKNHLQDSYELDERTRDRDLDGVMHFKPSASGLTTGSTEGCAKGKFRSGNATYTFLGCDAVTVQP